MFNLLGVTLLQPEAILAQRMPESATQLGPFLAQRMPESATQLGPFLSTLKELLREQYDDVIASGSRTLCVALAPGPRFQLWLAASEDESCADEQASLEKSCVELATPRVVDGPIALAMVFAIGSEPPPEAQLTLPDAWQNIVRASDTTLSVEQIITRLWAN